MYESTVILIFKESRGVLLLSILSRKKQVIRYEMKGAVFKVGTPVWIDFDESCCTGCA